MKQVNTRINNWLDKHQRVLWWFIFLGTCVVLAIFAVAILMLPADAVSPKFVNSLGAALVAAGLAAQAADGLTERKAGSHSRPTINVWGFLTAALGASFVFAGQVMV